MSERISSSDKGLEAEAPGAKMVVFRKPDMSGNFMALDRGI